MWHDRHKELVKLADSMEGLSEERQPKAVYQVLRKLEAKPPRPVRRLFNSDGELICDPIGVRQAFQQRQCDILRGEVVKIDQVLKLCSAPAVEFTTQDLIDVMPLIPREAQLQLLLADVNKGKSTGGQCLG